MRDQTIKELQANYLANFAPKPAMSDPQSRVETPHLRKRQNWLAMISLTTMMEKRTKKKTWK
jgi:hypothetical protein